MNKANDNEDDVTLIKIEIKNEPVNFSDQCSDQEDLNHDIQADKIKANETSINESYPRKLVHNQSWGISKAEVFVKTGIDDNIKETEGNNEISIDEDVDSHPMLNIPRTDKNLGEDETSVHGLGTIYTSDSLSLNPNPSHIVLDEEITRHSGVPDNILRVRRRKTFGCTFCNYQTQDGSNFSRHILTHSKAKLFKCSECDYESNQKVSMKRHSLTHSNTKLLTCSKCDYECDKRDKLFTHILTHSTAKLYECSDCVYKTNRKADLKRHILVIHTEAKSLKCSACNYATNWRADLTRHFVVHSETKLLQCSECEYQCNRQYRLKAHLLKHSQFSHS